MGRSWDQRPRHGPLLPLFMSQNQVADIWSDVSTCAKPAVRVLEKANFIPEKVVFPRRTSLGYALAPAILVQGSQSGKAVVGSN